MNFPGTRRRGNALSRQGQAAFNALHRFCNAFPSAAFVGELQSRVLSAGEKAAKKGGPPSVEYLKAVYEEAASYVEKKVSESGFGEALLSLQRELYRELEELVATGDSDTRHHFLIVVPVADRPMMLRKCLRSLVDQCRLYRYGGTSAGQGGTGVYRKISVFIVDDSADAANRRKIREIGEEIRHAGVPTYYIGEEEQTGVLTQVPADLMGKLSGLLGCFSGAVSPHKGASVSRNIALLYLHAVAKKLEERVLVYFIDSDEEFRVAVNRQEGPDDIHFINYFYWLDKLFSTDGIDVLTGKVVGDPPVSPAVTINTFLDDLILFLDTASDADGAQQCLFHSAQSGKKFSAEYHDMGGLFGYRTKTSPKQYCCGLRGPHTVRDCLEDVARKVSGFFYGLHPTRSQVYTYRGRVAEPEKARTVYTGNYLFGRSGFRHFIPFANLNLRMAGPTLGRILRVTLKEKFVSENLPLLHSRTLGDDFGNEFRSGVTAGGGDIDLSAEYLRQFWGDVMLFSVEALADRGYPQKKVPRDTISGVVLEVQERLLGLYRAKQEETAAKISKVNARIGDPDRWWNTNPGTHVNLDSLRSFCSIADNNLGERSSFFARVSAQIAEGFYIGTITHAIHSFHEDELLWERLLKTEIEVNFP